MLNHIALHCVPIHIGWYFDKRDQRLCQNGVTSRNPGATSSFSGTRWSRSLLREVVDRECVGAVQCASARARGINFQACSFKKAAVQETGAAGALRALHTLHPRRNDPHSSALPTQVLCEVSKAGLRAQYACTSVTTV